MTGFRFLHLADLHLETSFGGRAATRERLRRAALEAFENAVDYAIDHQLHAVLAAGDLYDDPVLSLQTEFAIQRQVQRLDEANRARVRHFPLQARFEVNEGADRCGSQLSKIEAAILDLARAGFTLQRMLEVIPEPDSEILRAIESLADDELVTPLD